MLKLLPAPTASGIFVKAFGLCLFPKCRLQQDQFDNRPLLHFILHINSVSVHLKIFFLKIFFLNFLFFKLLSCTLLLWHLKGFRNWSLEFSQAVQCEAALEQIHHLSKLHIAYFLSSTILIKKNLHTLKFYVKDMAVVWRMRESNIHVGFLVCSVEKHWKKIQFESETYPTPFSFSFLCDGEKDVYSPQLWTHAVHKWWRILIIDPLRLGVLLLFWIRLQPMSHSAPQLKWVNQRHRAKNVRTDKKSSCLLLCSQIKFPKLISRINFISLSVRRRRLLLPVAFRHFLTTKAKKLEAIRFVERLTLFEISSQCSYFFKRTKKSIKMTVIFIDSLILPVNCGNYREMNVGDVKKWLQGSQ